jgi:hypothetical protein
MKNNKCGYIIYLAPGLEVLTITIYDCLKKSKIEDEKIILLSPLYSSCNLTDDHRIRLNKILFKVDKSTTPDENIELNYYSDRLVLLGKDKDRSIEYARMVRCHYAFLAQNLNKRKINFYLLIEPLNDLFTNIVHFQSYCRFIIPIYFRRARTRGNSRNTWISISPNEKIDDAKYELAIRILQKKYGLVIAENKKEVYGSIKPKWSTLTYKNSAINLLNSINAYIRASLSVDIKKNVILGPSEAGVERVLRGIFRRNIKFEKVPLDEPFIIFPLQVFPEASTLSGGAFWMLGLIEMISKAIPENVTLIIKEHPDDPGYRPFYQYKYLKSLPNVRLIHPCINAADLLRNDKCRGVITVSSSLAEECLENGKPVLVLSKYPYYIDCAGVILRNLNDVSINSMKEAINLLLDMMISKATIIKSNEYAKKGYLNKTFPVDASHNNQELAQLFLDISVTLESMNDY